MKKNLFSIKLLVYLLFAIFAFLIFFIFSPFDMMERREYFSLFAGSAILFLILGIILTVFIFVKKIKGKLKVFLLFTGLSAPIAVISSILHNLVYALFIVWFGETFWGPYGDEPVFFLISVLVCPILFIIGSVGSVILLNKKNAS